MSAINKEVYDAFISAGVADEQATAAARAIPSSGEFATRSDVGELGAVFKSDIAELRAEFKSDIAEFRAEFKSDIAELRADTRSEIKDLELRMTVRFFASVGMVVAGIKALDFLIG